MTWHNAHDAYLESRVLAASPLELVRILYQTATGAVRDARRHLEAGEVLARSRAISKAGEVILELSAALDFQRGGDLAVRLGELYSYMIRRLTEANLKQADEPLAEVLGLLATLSEGWNAIQDTQPAAEPARQWTPPAFQGEQFSEAPSRAWSY